MNDCTCIKLTYLRKVLFYNLITSATELPRHLMLKGLLSLWFTNAWSSWSQLSLSMLHSNKVRQLEQHY
jgi:hypothetical protein